MLIILWNRIMNVSCNYLQFNLSDSVFEYHLLQPLPLYATFIFLYAPLMLFLYFVICSSTLSTVHTRIHHISRKLNSVWSQTMIRELRLSLHLSFSLSFSHIWFTSYDYFLFYVINVYSILINNIIYDYHLFDMIWSSKHHTINVYSILCV